MTALLSPIPSLAAEAGWQIWAKKLIGEKEEVRNTSLKELKKIKDLNQQLNKALDSEAEKALALDVIVALQLQDFNPRLLQAALTDREGITVLAINGLLTTTNRQQIGKEFLKHLTMRMPLLSESAIVAMIDGLGRMGKKIPSELWQKLFTHPAHEVRSAAITYLRVMHMNYKLRPSSDFLRQGLAEASRQLRMQTAFFVFELKDHPAYQAIFAACLQSSNSEVRMACEGPKLKDPKKKNGSRRG